MKQHQPLTINEVAKITGKAKQTIRVALQHGILPYGTAYKMPGSSKYVYEIYPEKFYDLYGREREDYEQSEGQAN